MPVAKEEYHQLRNWFAVVFDFEPRPYVTPETHPIACLASIEARWPAKARAGLEMAINDTIEEAGAWPEEKIRRLDALLEDQDLPTFAGMRQRFSKDIARILRRASINTDVEHYAARNALELFAENDRRRLADLLASYERNSIKPA